MFDRTAFAVSKKDRLILISNGIAGAFCRNRQPGNRRLEECCSRGSGNGTDCGGYVGRG